MKYKSATSQVLLLVTGWSLSEIVVGFDSPSRPYLKFKPETAFEKNSRIRTDGHVVRFILNTMYLCMMLVCPDLFKFY